MEHLFTHDHLTIGDVLVVKNPLGIYLLEPKMLLVHSGWKLIGVNEKGQEIYSKSSKLNFTEDLKQN